MTETYASGEGPSSVRIGAVQPTAGAFGFALHDGDGLPVARFAFETADEAQRARQDLSRAAARAASSIAESAAPAPDRRSPSKAAAVSDGPSTWRQRTYTLLEEGMMETVAGRVIESLLVVLIVLNVAAVALESVPSIYTRLRPVFIGFEEFSLAAYTIEYFARVWSSIEDPRIGTRGAFRGRLAFALRPMMVVDFLAFAPSYLGVFFGIDLRVLRIFRLFRLLKLARYSQALQALLSVLLAERSALFASVILLLSTMCLEGELMHLAEGHIQPNTLGTLPGAMYWALTTLTTVGYGDITPITPLGKAIAGMTMVTGLALFALPVGIIANGFVTGLSRRRFAITWTMLRRQPLLKGMDANALSEVLDGASASVLKQHAQLALAGAEALKFYLVIQGCARAETEGGEEELGPGSAIGAEALHHAGTYARTVTAETDMRVLIFNGDELRRLARKYPRLRERLAGSLAASEFAGAADPSVRLRALETENQRLRELLVDRLLEKTPAEQ
jgi:voltage-gated potassium channel